MVGVDLMPLVPLVILDLCGGTGVWSQPYVDAKYDVRIIDPERNGQDVRLIEKLNDCVP